MQELDKKDRELLNAARAAITKNYDGEKFMHTVGAAVRCADGKIFTGVNVYSVHGACAEQVALGAAITNGERDFAAVVAVRGGDGEEILPPCGNCRQILCDYAPDCMVILGTAQGPRASCCPLHTRSNRSNGKKSAKKILRRLNFSAFTVFLDKFFV